jgi:hypothetical protein
VHCCCFGWQHDIGIDLIMRAIGAKFASVPNSAFVCPWSSFCCKFPVCTSQRKAEFTCR